MDLKRLYLIRLAVLFSQIPKCYQRLSICLKKFLLQFIFGVYRKLELARPCAVSPQDWFFKVSLAFHSSQPTLNPMYHVRLSSLVSLLSNGRSTGNSFLKKFSLLKDLLWLCYSSIYDSYGLLHSIIGLKKKVESFLLFLLSSKEVAQRRKKRIAEQQQILSRRGKRDSLLAPLTTILSLKLYLHLILWVFSVHEACIINFILGISTLFHFYCFGPVFQIIFQLVCF